MDDKRKEPRISKKLAVINIPDSKIENLSLSGGFIRTRETLGQFFNLSIQLNIYQLINLQCEYVRKAEYGIGFRIKEIRDNKSSEYSEFIKKEITFSSVFSKDRIWRHEHFITAEETNVFGNLYFADFFKLQGKARELMVMHHEPYIHQKMAESGDSLATIDAYNKFYKHCYFGEKILIEVTTKDIMRSRATMVFKFRNKEDNEIRAEGYQRFCCLSNNGKIRKLPKIFDFLSYYEQS